MLLLLTNKIAPPPCTQGISLNLHRLKHIGDTCCKDTNNPCNYSLNDIFLHII